MVVRPKRRASANALRAPRPRSAAVGSGIARDTRRHGRVLEHARRLAAARLAHDGAAFGIRRVRRPRPPARSAIVFATAMCPS